MFGKFFFVCGFFYVSRIIGYFGLCMNMYVDVLIKYMMLFFLFVLYFFRLILLFVLFFIGFIVMFCGLWVNMLVVNRIFWMLWKRLRRFWVM